MPHKLNSPAQSAEIPFGMLIIPGQLSSPLPLERTDIIGQITGPLASISITQFFTNPLTQPAELEYLFPLPHKAAITDFALRVNQRIIQGDLRETESAYRDFEQALSKGQQAALLEHRRPNLFAVRLANVQPGESVQTSVHYQETVPFRDGEYELVIPMGLTPKYTSPSHPDEAKGVQAPIALPGEHIGKVEIALMVDAGAPLAQPTSPSHALLITRLDERRLNLWLASPALPDHDFVLRLPVAADALKLTSFLTRHSGGDVFYASLIPPVDPETEIEPASREFVFVLDRSGSMSGEPIAQARNALRACLRSLNPRDSFSILLFDDRLDWFQPKPQAVNQANIDSADSFLSRVEGRGGTEIIPAIQTALDLPTDPERTRYVVFLTDGAVSADERALAEVRHKLGNARFFTFGIGPSVNRAFLQKLASIGRGTCEFLQLNEDIEGAILRFQDRVSIPVITDLQLECLRGKVWDTYPTLLPDLFSGTPLEIVGRVKPDAHTTPRLVILGKRLGKPIKMIADLIPLPTPEPAILRAWARARVDDLEQQAESREKPHHKVRDEIISLALEHHLVTQFTSFVAIDSAIINPDGKPRLIFVSQPLPQGLDIQGFSQPQSVNFMHSVVKARSSPRLSRSLREFIGNDTSSFQPSSPILSDLDLPTFLRSPDPEDNTQSARYSAPQVDSHETILRWLARTQNLDGSWSSGSEFTALALLFFVRSGNTTRTGHFRTQVKRAAAWLAGADLSGFSLHLAALAFKELSAATTHPDHLNLARQLHTRLPKPQDLKEELIGTILLNQPISITTPSIIVELDDLRITRLTSSTQSAPQFLLEGSDADLGRLWAALPPPPQP